MRNLPDYLFSCDDGALYDTRNAQWSQESPLRPLFRRHFTQINNAHELKATLRAGPYAWPGGYPLYFLASDGEALSFDSVRENLREVLFAIATHSRCGWRVIGCQINWEESDMVCAHCGKHIESAYASETEVEEE
jgi:hypothetical protein